MQDRPPQQLMKEVEAVRALVQEQDAAARRRARLEEQPAGVRLLTVLLTGVSVALAVVAFQARVPRMDIVVDIMEGDGEELPSWVEMARVQLDGLLSMLRGGGSRGSLS